MHQPQVVVLGSINVDLVVTLERLPGPGETVSGGTLTRHGGGKGANQAVAAVRAGARTALVAAVGDDEAGATSIAELEAAGIDCSGVAVRPGVSTGCALIAVDDAGNNQIAVAPGANRELPTFPSALLEGSPGILLISFEAPDPVIDVAASEAIGRGWSVVVNPAPVRPPTPGLLAARPIMVPNEHEALVFAGVADPVTAAEVLHDRWNAPVIVTLGAEGARVVDADGSATVPAPRVDVVDTTGAGDVFCGTLAARLAHGDTRRRSVERAVEAASLSTRTRGARAD